MKKTATTKNQIMDYLQWSSKEYDDRVFQSYWNWCQIYGKYPSKIQQLLANAAVNKWFLTEYHKCELQFLKIVDVVPNRVETLQGHYKASTSYVQTRWNQPLLDQIKRNRDFSNQIIENVIYYAN